MDSGVDGSFTETGGRDGLPVIHIRNLFDCLASSSMFCACLPQSIFITFFDSCLVLKALASEGYVLLEQWSMSRSLMSLVNGPLCEIHSSLFHHAFLARGSSFVDLHGAKSFCLSVCLLVIVSVGYLVLSR